ncbi:MAG: HEAT repeat domain-containing protein [Gemmataceae bacterium]|nr:HEAT repeat domain-containing protein [Gemmataceae bacterium]
MSNAKCRGWRGSGRAAVVLRRGGFALLLLFPLVLGLGSEGRLTARLAAQEPEYQGKKASLWLDMLANDASVRKRALAAEAAGRLWQEHRYTEALAGILRAVRVDRSAAVRLTAAQVLAGLPERDLRACTKELAEALSAEKDSRVRRELALLLARHEELARPAVPGLVQALRDPQAAVRAAAAEALAVAGPEAKSAAAELVTLLRDSDPAVRRAAVRALGRIEPAGASAVADTLAALLPQEKDRELRWEIVLSLGLLQEKTPAVLQALHQLLQQEDGELRLRALRVLGSFKTAAQGSAADVLRLARSDPLKSVRQEAVHTFAALHGSDLIQHLPELLRLLQDPEYEVRLAVVEEVGALGPALQNHAEVLRTLRQRLSDPHLKVREAAAAALKRIEQKPKSDKD